MLSIKKTGGSTEFDLPVVPADVQADLDRWYDNGSWSELPRIVTSNNYGPDDPKPRIGTLYWPIVGASRFAFGVFVIDSFTLGLLRTELGSSNAVTLCYRDDPDDAGETARTFPLYLISSRPVSRTAGSDPFPTVATDGDDAYLITLVDKRWYWAQANGTALSSAPASWSSLFTTLFTRAGVDTSFSLDAVDADYLTPTDRWAGAQADEQSVAYLLDCAAACVGSRIVTSTTGTTVQRPSGANKTVVTDFHAANLDRFGGGGLLDDTEILRGLPKTVRVAWPDGTSETTTVATGLTNAVVTVTHDCPSTATGGQRTALLAQWAADWYAWQQVPLDAIYDGFVLPPYSGFAGSCEIRHDCMTGYTRISRPYQGHQFHDTPRADVYTSWKNVVRAATTANGTDATAFEAGDTIDGVTLAAGDRILRKNQTAGAENGIFVVQSSGAPVRAPDADGVDELVGAVVWVSEGTTNADTIWACTTNATITPGTTATVWVKVYPAAASTPAPFGWFARLVSESSGAWKWVKVVQSGGSWIDSGATSADWNAYPSKIDPTLTCNPTPGQRVWMIESTDTGKYEFMMVLSPPLLGEVTTSATAHVVEQKTWSAGAIADYSPATTFSNCRSVTGSTIAVGTTVLVWKIPDVDGEHWIMPVVKNRYSVDYDATGGLQFVNDESAPGNWTYYGTEGTGTKGWLDLVAALGGSTVDTTDLPQALFWTGSGPLKYLDAPSFDGTYSLKITKSGSTYTIGWV